MVCEAPLTFFTGKLYAQPFSKDSDYQAGVRDWERPEERKLTHVS